MIQFNDRNTQLDDLLARIAESIQLDDNRKERMRSAYEAIENLLKEDDAFFKHVDFEIYPQGSVIIGTTVKPTAKNEFDLDIVVHIKVDWNQYTPEQIYNALKCVLQNSGHHNEKVELKNRCIRLNYAGDFHMDILPGCQETEFDNNKLVVPDRELKDWTSSNPRGFAKWFIHKSNSVKMTLLEKAYAMEELPPDEFAKKKPLQRAVQLIKMYRDQYFKDNSDMATSSIILTTITGEYYNGEDSIYGTIDNVIRKIKQQLYNMMWTGERIVILNPINQEEDFTDKWANDKEPELYEHFKKYIEYLNEEWKKLKKENGIIEEARILSKLFGESAYQKGQKSQTDFIEKARKNQTLGINKKTGILTGVGTFSTASIKSNTFFGGEQN